MRKVLKLRSLQGSEIKDYLEPPEHFSSQSEGPFKQVILDEGYTNHGTIKSRIHKPRNSTSETFVFIQKLKADY